MKIKKGMIINQNIILEDEFCEKENNRYRYYCLRQCPCGNVVKTLKQSLAKSNKCNQCAYKGERLNRRKRPYEAIYNIFVSRAKYPVSITYEDFLFLTQEKNCHYCDSDVYWQEYRTKKSKDLGGSGSNLDRKNNDKGYHMDNVVVCCGRCNYAKGSHFSYDEWKQIGEVIKSMPKREYKITPQSFGTNRGND